MEENALGGAGREKVTLWEGGKLSDTSHWAHPSPLPHLSTNVNFGKSGVMLGIGNDVAFRSSPSLSIKSWHNATHKDSSFQSTTPCLSLPFQILGGRERESAEECDAGNDEYP